MTSPPRLPVIFCFAGQGSQYYRMGAELLECDPVFRQWMQAGDSLVARRHGFSLIDEIYHCGRGPQQPFDRFAASHPAIFLVQYALAKVMQHHRVRPDQLLGISLGEFTAQAVAGMVGFEAALEAVSDQPGLLTRSCPPGGMIAVLGAPDLHARLPLLAANSAIAGINSRGHFVLAALAEHLDAIEAALLDAGAAFQRLPVPHPFHSRFIDQAESVCRPAMDGIRRESPFWPVWSCCTAAPVDASRAATLSWDIVRQPMRVAEVIAAIEAQGGATYVDLSPSGTLAALLRQALPPGSPSRPLSVMSPYGSDRKRLAATLAALGATAP